LPNKGNDGLSVDDLKAVVPAQAGIHAEYASARRRNAAARHDFSALILPD
jgi:hypothetical protein